MPHLTDLKESAYRAHLGTSFSPEKRAESTIAQFESQLSADLASVPSHYRDKYIQKYRQHLSSWLSSKSRCISSMITGPARFPIDRAKKFNRWEENKYNDFQAWRERMLKAFERSTRKAAVAEAGGELAIQVKKLADLKKAQELYKSINAIIRKKTPFEGKSQMLRELGLQLETIDQVLKPDSMGYLGIPPYKLQNNLANIKRVEQRVKELEQKEQLKAQQEEKGAPAEVVINGVKVVTNFEIDRLQLFFDGKPADHIRQELKSSGFHWSPFYGCWQRKHTGNAIYSAKNILAKVCVS